MKRIIAILLLTMGLKPVADAQQTILQYLSGTDKDHTVLWDFFCTSGMNSGKWTKIAVPSNWEQQGFGGYSYGHDKIKTNEQGLYKYHFTALKEWTNKKVFIVFEGSMTDTEVKINGKPAGAIHQGGFYRFKYDITEHIKFGSSNLLEATVSKMSAQASVNKAERNGDFWTLGGIYRPVYLEIVPQTFIDRVAIDAKADGSFSMDVYTVNTGKSNDIEAQVQKLNGENLGNPFYLPVARVQDKYVLQNQFSNPALWNPEFPNLYQVQVSIKEHGKIIHQLTQKFGFRTAELRVKDGFYVNGTKVIFKGVCRHSEWPETGRALSKDISLLDIGLMKEMNMNAVRMSHYPPDQHFLDMCDSLGLFVLDELTGWQACYDTLAGRPLVKELVVRDVNHPSVVIWDNGNEGGWNRALDNDYALYDPQKRLVIHPWEKFNGTDTKHYPDYNYVVNSSLYGHDVFFPTEFMHGLYDGGHGAGLDDFWNLILQHPYGAGGFLWSFHDEGIVRKDKKDSIDTDGNHAPDGIVGPHREKEGSFYAIREIFSPVKITMKEWPVVFDGTIPVENRYHFTNLNQCRFQWQLVNYKKPADWSAGYSVMKNGLGEAPAIAPGSSGSIPLALPEDYKNYDALLLAAYDPFHNLVYKWSWKIKDNQQLLNGILVLKDTAAITTLETDSSILVKSGGISVSFSKKEGKIADMRSSHGDKMSFGGAPVLVGGRASFTGLKHFKENDGYVIELEYEGDLKYARWKMFNGGWMSLEYEYSLNGKYPFAGISFTYPENYVLGAKWLGRGPYRVWKNRLPGTAENVWKNANNNTQTGSAPWIFPEFKGYYADITWMEMNTVEGKFLMASKDNGIYVRLFDFYGLSGVKPAPDLPAGNISFLDAIPPIGTKLALNISYNAAVLGPQSEWAVINKPVKHTLYFYFGLQKTNALNQQYQTSLTDELF